MPATESPAILKKVSRNLFFIIVTMTTLAFLGMVGPFLLTVLWAIVLTIIFYGPYGVIRKKIGIRRANLAAGITTLLVFLFVIVPFVLLSLAIVDQGVGLYESVQSGEMDPTIVLHYFEEKVPQAAEILSDYGVAMEDLKVRLSNMAVEVSQFVANKALTFGGSLINIFVQFTLVLYLFFFFLRDGRSIMRSITNTIPMGNIRERKLFHRFAQVSKATLKGTLVVAAVQGIIGGITFAILGVPAALLCGVAMILLALLPVGGSAIVWLPTAIIFIAQGQVGKGIALILVGALIIGLVDNLLRPLLVGRDTEMPDYLVLISTLGGITAFGLSGFVVGPTIAALFITVWEMMGKEYGGRVS